MSESNKRHRRNELILVGVIAVAAVLYFLWLAFRPATVGGEVVVQIGGEEYVRLPLSEDAELDISQEGNKHNYLIIKNGMADVTEASCPDGVCVHQPSISRNNETITCLPNKVLVIIENGEDSELDVISK